MCHEGDVIGGFTIPADGALLLFMARGAVKIWREGELTTVIDEIPGERDGRFNDVIADPAGRVYCGTMETEGHRAALYRLDTDGSIEKVLGDIGVSNGMGFTPDRKRLYYTDTRTRRIDVLDYDQATGAITNRRPFVTVTDDAGNPDGMTVDAQGYVWGARWGGSCLVRYAPDGTEERRIHFPAVRVSSVIFGGPDYSDIYVTTAGGQDKAQFGPGAGALYRVRLGIRGVPEFYSRVLL
jgi:D-xylonolactonase